MLSTRGGMDIERSRRRRPRRSRRCTSTRCSASSPSTAAGSPSRPASTPTSCAPIGAFLERLYARVRRRGGDARRGQPADRDARAHARRARREGHPRRQLALPPPRERRAARPLERGPAGADGQGAPPDLRQARRQHRHPRQRRRPGDVDARRRRAARRRARELPRRRRRRQGRGDHRGGRGDPLGPEGQGGAVQHLRRHHALRRGRARPDRGLRADQADGAVRRAPRRHQRRGGPRAARGGRAAQRRTRRARWTRRPRASWSSRDERHRRPRDAPVRVGHHRARGQLPLAQQPRLRHQRRRRRDARQGRPGRRGDPGLRHLPRGGRATRREHGDDLRAAAVRRRLDPRGRRRRHHDDHRDHRGHPRPRRAARLHAPASARPACG